MGKLITEDVEYKSIVKELIESPAVNKMKNFRQHYTSSCFDHCLKVSYYCYKICKKLKLDYKSAARAGLLHDLFLYDWRVKQEGRKSLHAFRHPYVAYRRASALFSINKKEKDIIIKHMWPLTIILPKYPESYIITLVDKYCALEECYQYYSKKLLSKKVYRLAGLLVLAIFIHIP